VGHVWILMNNKECVEKCALKSVCSTLRYFKKDILIKDSFVTVSWGKVVGHNTQFELIDGWHCSLATLLVSS
jgi:hypothetical protein